MRKTVEPLNVGLMSDKSGRKYRMLERSVKRMYNQGSIFNTKGFYLVRKWKRTTLAVLKCIPHGGDCYRRYGEHRSWFT